MRTRTVLAVCLGGMLPALSYSAQFGDIDLTDYAAAEFHPASVEKGRPYTPVKHQYNVGFVSPPDVVADAIKLNGVGSLVPVHDDPQTQEQHQARDELFITQQRCEQFKKFPPLKIDAAPDFDLSQVSCFEGCAAEYSRLGADPVSGVVHYARSFDGQVCS